MKNQYFAGIDIAKKENVVTIKDFKNFENTFSFGNDQSGFKELLSQAADKETTFCLEATGFYHLPLAFHLLDNGFRIKVINPLLTKKMARANIRKAKTDKIDSKHLAWLAQLGEGHDFNESKLVCQLKVLCRHRLFLKKEMVRTKKHLQSIDFRNAIFQEEKLNFLPEINIESVDLIGIMGMKAKQIEQMILKLSEGIADIDYLDSLPGVSRLLACQIYSELGDITRFKQAKSLVAYAGIDPSVSQSGDSLNVTGRMSKRGSPYLRYYLFLAARAAIRCDKELGEYYQKKKAEKKHYYVRLMAVSRKLLYRINRVLRDKRDYIRS